jgi:hypothetical protein
MFDILTFVILKFDTLTFVILTFVILTFVILTFVILTFVILTFVILTFDILTFDICIWLGQKSSKVKCNPDHLFRQAQALLGDPLVGAALVDDRVPQEELHAFAGAPHDLRTMLSFFKHFLQKMDYNNWRFWIKMLILYAISWTKRLFSIKRLVAKIG